MSKNAIKVSELNNYIKKIIDMDYLIKNIAVEGEISNLKKHSNGNIYFSLKDEKSRINAIVYSTNANFDFDLQEGMSIIATGVVSFYDREGQINFYIDEIKLRGEGYLYQDFLNLKKKLGSEGLFDARHKKKIVKYPKSIGLITSDTGAAVRDVLNNLYKRNNLVDVYLYPSFVQGRLASESVINGIKFFNENKKVDTIVIARGGGSFEDLSAFNDEKLAREIYSSDIPIISAIGHEIDFCISDFVADLRASTPTNAVELVTGSKKDLINELFDLISNLFNSMNNRIHREKYQNLDLFNTLSQKNPIGLINKEERKLDFLKRHLDFNIQNKMHSNQNRMLEAKINLKSYDLKKDDDYRRLSNLKFYLNKNFSSKLHLNENYLRYNLNYLEKSAVSNLGNSKSRLNFNYNLIIKNNPKVKAHENKIRLKNIKKYLDKNVSVKRLNDEKNRLLSFKSYLINIGKKLDEEVNSYSNRNYDLKTFLDKNIYGYLNDLNNLLNYDLMNLNVKFDSIGKVELVNKDGNKITTARELSVGDELTILLKDGSIESTVKNIRMRSD